jgi:hypothetical protein
MRFGTEFPPKMRDFLRRRRPVRVTGVAVEHQFSGLQDMFKFFVTERHGLVMVVRTDNIKIDSLAQKAS